MLVSMLSMVVALAAGPPVITNPQWLRRPDGDDVARHYPIPALRDWVDGEATIGCLVSTTGLLSDCAVIRESPAGYNFGVAALRLSGTLRMKPPKVDGAPVAVAAVRVPITFKMPGLEPETLENGIQCYGLLGAELDANSAGSADLVVHLRQSYTRMGALMGIGDRAIADRMSAARRAPTTDPAQIAECRRTREIWSGRR